LHNSKEAIKEADNEQSKKKEPSFHRKINIFFSTYLPIYISKVFNFAHYQQEVNIQ